MRRYIVFAYGLASYAIFFGTFLYAAAFVGGFLVPRRLDGEPRLSLPMALAIDTALLAIFAVQHSVMARSAFKRRLTRFIPASAERSTYVLFSSLALILLFHFWEPLGPSIWNVESQIGRVLLWTFFACGWLSVLATTFLINHFDLFGLRQVWFYLREKQYQHLTFKTPGPYKLVRHPLYVGWLIAFWATPTMTAGHLFFALMTTAYILIAIQFEERDLVTYHGSRYADYRKQVPMLLPIARRRKRERSSETLLPDRAFSPR